MMFRTIHITHNRLQRQTAVLAEKAIFVTLDKMSSMKKASVVEKTQR